MATISTRMKVKGVESFKNVMEQLGVILGKYNIHEEDAEAIIDLLADYFVEVEEIPNMV